MTVMEATPRIFEEKNGRLPVDDEFITPEDFTDFTKSEMTLYDTLTLVMLVVLAIFFF